MSDGTGPAGVGSGGVLSHPAYGRLRRVTPVASVLLCDNPGKMSLEGTNTWVLGAPGERGVVVVDPGPDDAEHLGRVAAVDEVVLTIVTHRHADHTGGVERFAQLTGSPVHAVDPAFRRGGGGGLPDGETIEAAGVSLRVLATPGHTADSVSLVLDAEGAAGAVLTGDTVLGRGTTVLDPADGSLRDYLHSLGRLIDVGAGRVCLPAHGPELADVATISREYLAHREQRLDQVRAAVDVLGADATPRQVVEHVYQDVDPSLWDAAEWSVRVQLAYLRGEPCG